MQLCRLGDKALDDGRRIVPRRGAAEPSRRRDLVKRDHRQLADDALDLVLVRIGPVTVGADPIELATKDAVDVRPGAVLEKAVIAADVIKIQENLDEPTIVVIAMPHLRVDAIARRRLGMPERTADI